MFGLNFKSSSFWGKKFGLVTFESSAPQSESLWRHQVGFLVAQRIGLPIVLFIPTSTPAMMIQRLKVSLSEVWGHEAGLLQDCIRTKLLTPWGSGCGSVGRVVASDTRDPRIKSRHQQNFIYSCTIKKTKIKKKGWDWPIFQKTTSIPTGQARRVSA